VADDERAVAQVRRLGLAIFDLREVAEVARLMADEDPDLRLARRIGEIGPDTAIAEARATPPSTALGSFAIRVVLETGLLVTYGRPFTPGRGTGFPIDGEFVPEAKRELHRHLLSLRHQVYAHVDASPAEGFRRSVSYEARPDGGESDEFRSPRLLNEHELRSMAELADEIVERLESARCAAAAETGA
jgi:hypothetical protein